MCKTLLMVGVLWLLASCATPNTNPQQLVANADPRAGRDAIQAYGCGGCHTIPGVPNAYARVGPSLQDIAAQSYLAGRLPNTAENMVLWIRDPQGVEPGVAMPDLGVSENDARNIAAYLYSMGR